MEYTFGQLLLTYIGGVIAGGMLVYFIMRERVEWPSEAPLDDPKRMNFTSIDALPKEFPAGTLHAPTWDPEKETADEHVDSLAAPEFDPMSAHERYEAAERANEEQRIEDEREKDTLENHIKAHLRSGYVMVDGVARRFSFCLAEGEKTPFGKMFYRNEEPEECLSIYIDDQRRITQPPEWYDMISDCYRLVDGVKSLRYALMLSNGAEQDAIERPLRLVYHDHSYLPVIKVYTDMSWFDDLRWQGPVIVTGHNGQAMGIVPSTKPYGVHLLMEEALTKADPFLNAMPADCDGHKELVEGLVELRNAIKEAGCHAKEVEETREGV